MWSPSIHYHGGLFHFRAPQGEKALWNSPTFFGRQAPLLVGQKGPPTFAAIQTYTYSEASIWSEQV